MRKLIRDKRGVAAVIQVIVLLATLMIGAIVFSQLKQQAYDVANQNNDTDATNFINDAASTGWAAFNLYTIAAIVMAAGFILTLLYVWGRGGGGGV